MGIIIMNCLSEVDTTCDGSTVSMDAEGWQLLISEVENLITSGYTLAKEMFLTDEMYYLNKAANAAKCAVTSGFVNMWYLIGSVYYALNFVGQDGLLSGNLWAYYPTICSCIIEVDGYVTMFSSFASNLFSFGSSDETAELCTDNNGTQLTTTDADGNTVDMDADNSGLSGCPCYDDTNTEYTCMAD